MRTIPYGIANASARALHAQLYPGRIIYVGRTRDGHLLTGAVIEGRSPPSRNRKYVHDGLVVRTAVADPSKPSGKPENTIYDAMLQYEYEDLYVVTNGRQTNSITVTSTINRGLEGALAGWKYEDDDSATPRISGMVSRAGQAELMLIRKSPFGTPSRHHSVYEDLSPGYAWCLQTYDGGEKDPLVSYDGSPYLLPIRGNTPRAVANHIMALLDMRNFVGVAVKLINPSDRQTEVAIVNACDAA